MRRLTVLLLLATAVALPATTADATPRPEFGSTDWRQVSAGTVSTCGIRTNGRAYCWGTDNEGLLGNGGMDENSQLPTEVAGADTDWRQVSVGGDVACGLRTSGRLYCWGQDTLGQLGNVAAGPSSTPVQVAGNSTAWRSVSVGDSTACARRANGTLRCWGADNFGQVGNDATLGSFVTTPALVAGGFTDWRSFDVGV